MAGITWVSVAPRVPKLRDSCNACAAGKIKCPKQKPTCSRCQKRGQKCEYEATRRIGRPYKENLNVQVPTNKARATEQRQAQDAILPTGDSRVSLSQDAAEMTPSMDNELLEPTVFDQISMPKIMPANQDNLPAFAPSANTDPLLLSGPLATNFDSGLDEFFTTSMESLQTLESMQCDLSSLDGCDNSSLSYGDTFSNSSGGLSPSQPCVETAMSLDSSCSNLGSMNSPQFRDSNSCACLVTAIGFLKQSPTNSDSTEHRTKTAPQEKIEDDLDFCSLASVQRFIAQHEVIMQAVESILQCPCSLEDGYLLTVLCLVLFKNLDCYAAAGNNACAAAVRGCVTAPAPANKEIQSRMNSPSLPTFGASDRTIGADDGQDKRRNIQTLMGKMHQIQQLVNKLSARLKGGSLGVTPTGEHSMHDHATLGIDGSAVTGPFSRSMFHQMEADLRQRLRKVSLATVEMMRQL